MNIFQAIILGLVQGITEFLPISSTAHLTIAGKLMHLISEHNPERWTAFIAVIQLGTLAATLVYFWKDLINIIGSFLKYNFKNRVKFSEQNLDSKLGWLIIIGTIPVIIFGLLFKNVIEGSLTKNLYVIAGSLIGLALVLAFAEFIARLKKDINNLSIKDAIVIGVAQSFALIPGSSRSGTTIAGGLFMGLKRETAARFSFLLSIPTVLASGLLELYESIPSLDSSMALNLFLSTLAAAVSGYLAIDFLLKYLRRNSTFLFVYYRIALGILIIILLSLNIILP